VERGVSDIPVIKAILAEGITSVESVLREDPTSSEALAYRGRLRWRMYLWGIAGVDAPLLDSAETDLRRAAAATPPIAFAVQDLSEIVWMERRRFAEARELAVRAYKLDAYQDETGLLINRIAIASLNLGEDADALKWCRVGLRRYPQQPQHLACVLEVMAWGNQPALPDSAWALYRRLVVRHATDRVRWHYLLRVAAVHARAGEKSDAEKLVAQVRKEMGDARVDRTYYLPWEAGVFFRLGKNVEAERLFDQFRLKVPSDAPLWANGIPLRGFVAPAAQRPVP
jgi:tetratricopeptide (TPR) repeat protein